MRDRISEIKLCKYVLFIFLFIFTYSLSSSYVEASATDSSATNKLWKTSLTIEGCSQPPLNWGLEDITLVETISNILSRSRSPRAESGPPPRNRNIALTRIGLVYEFEGSIHYTLEPLPYIFESALLSFFNNPDSVTEDYESQKADITHILDTSQYTHIVGSANFLPPPKPSIISPQKIRKHYADSLKDHLENILGERPGDTGRYYHSEQAVICALMKSEILEELMGKIIGSISDKDPSSLKIHGVVIDMLSYYTACTTCTNTLASLPSSPQFIENLHTLLLPLRAHIEDSFGLWVTESSIYPFEPEKERAEQENQSETIDMPILLRGHKQIKLYHQLPLK